ncbi:AppF1 [Desulforapulum autotrophicum HRM2]|uniref:AppF1 n=1 Tax=Desulforapulum autotrophicum (strain ATCC 43914 / DSM 3382 / VKM B-1955 / HRM2) TaxID=177437 RepID=C0Q8R1_DESAH|nr:oligopeptide/dipeptide ABC transporter ATP-binding protein [Desulforapulum autotrophicum]ACN14401.1 AppF1 [Desulforapulum autotrophicum HRM2]
MAEPALKTEDITKTYRVNAGMFKGKKDLKAVNGVSLSIPKGSILGLVGESGCGKTTIAKMILGLERPTTGKLFIAGKDVSVMPQKQIARIIQPVFQDPYSSLNPRKSIAKIISLPLRAQGLTNGKQDLEQKVDEIMEIVGLQPRLKHNYPNQLSGGQRQRVAVARALIMRPDVVLCDEPTSALDVSVQAQILNMLMELRTELDLTYLFISHDLAVVEHIASHVAVMYLGRIVEQGEARTIFASPCHPYTQALLGSVLTPDPGMGLPDLHLGIEYPNPIDPPSGCTFHPRCIKCQDLCRQTRPELRLKSEKLVACHYPDNF